MSPLAIVILVLAVIGGVLWLVFSQLRRILTRRAQAMRERFPTAEVIISGANLFGQESKGVAQIRGNGTLVVTDSEIVFERLLPRTEFRIPRAQIESIETPKQFRGKLAGGQPLLKVNYRNESGETDAMAWWVRDVESLKQLLEKHSV
jgi:hypothetical protein